jgi:hypothetical protein
MEVAHPCLDGVESDSFRNHVLATLASDMEGSFVSNFASPYALSLNHNKGCLRCGIAFSNFHFVRIKVLGTIEAISSGSCK